MKRTVFALAACAAFALAAPAFAYSPPDPGGHVLVIDQGHLKSGDPFGAVNLMLSDSNYVGAIVQQLGHTPPLIGDSPGHMLALIIDTRDSSTFDSFRLVGHAPPLIAYAIGDMREGNGGISGAGHGTLLQTWTASATAGGNLQIMEHADSALT